MGSTVTSEKGSAAICVGAGPQFAPPIARKAHVSSKAVRSRMDFMEAGFDQARRLLTQGVEVGKAVIEGVAVGNGVGGGSVEEGVQVGGGNEGVQVGGGRGVSVEGAGLAVHVRVGKIIEMGVSVGVRVATFGTQICCPALMTV